MSCVESVRVMAAATAMAVHPLEKPAGHVGVTHSARRSLVPARPPDTASREAGIRWQAVACMTSL